MKIIWNGHSCFTLDTAQGTAVVDPFQDNYVPGCGAIRPKADAVFCSHGHGDHCGAEVVTLSGAPMEMGVETIPTWHDEVQGAKRGPNTIHVFSAEGMRVVHLGDLGCELTGEQAEHLKGADVLLLPIGGVYTIDPAQAIQVARQLSPRIVIPMHYKGEGFGFDVIAPLEDFLPLWQGSVKVLSSNVVEVTPNTPAQLMVPAHPCTL